MNISKIMRKVARESTDKPQHFQISEEVVTSMECILEQVTQEITKEAISKLAGNERRVTTRCMSKALANVFSLAKIHGSVLSPIFLAHLPPRSTQNRVHLETPCLTPRAFSNGFSKRLE